MTTRLSETAAAYRTEARAPHTKLSISLPTDLADELRAAAAESGLGVSAIVAAAVRQSIASSEQARLDRALDLDAEHNAEWANDALTLTARAWADLEW
jgi:plasmid stability protein